MHKNILTQLYYDPATGYVSAEKLYHKVKSKNIPYKEVVDFVKDQEVSQIKGSVKPYYPPIVADYRKQIYQIDLMFYENLKPFNDQRGIFLNVIDVYSRKAWSEPLTNKTAKSVADAFKKILFFGKPEQVQSDRGSEFMGAFKKLMKEKGIILKFVEPGDKTKQGIIERFNGTLRDKIDRYLVAHNTNRFIDVLPKIISNYNNTVHRTIKTTPNKVWSEDALPGNLEDNARRMSQASSIVNQFNVGDKVRVLNKPRGKQGQPIEQTFTKGRRKYSEKIHTIEKVENFMIYVEGKESPYKFYEVKKLNDVELDPSRLVSKKPEQKVQHKPGLVEAPNTRGKKVDYRKLAGMT